MIDITATGAGRPSAGVAIDRPTYFRPFQQELAMAAETTTDDALHGAEASAVVKAEPTSPRNYDEAAVSRLVRRGILELVKEGPPQFDMTAPHVRRP